MSYIIIRETRDYDMPALSELVRNAFLSNINFSWQNAVFSEVTVQMIILLAALLFILGGVSPVYCLMSIPIVLIGIYVVIYGAVIMKSAQMIYEKKPLQCWVAEAYEPTLLANPKCTLYKILSKIEADAMDLDISGMRRKIVGTVAVMQHMQKEDWAWLFRLAVEKDYRRKGIGLKLVGTVQEWCRDNQYNNLELVMTECQEGSRQLFDDARFNVRQLYHKQLVSTVITLQMFQLRYEVRSTF